jgi:hypothetical protein
MNPTGAKRRIFERPTTFYLQGNEAFSELASTTDRANRLDNRSVDIGATIRLIGRDGVPPKIKRKSPAIRSTIEGRDIEIAGVHGARPSHRHHLQTTTTDDGQQAPGGRYYK